MDDGPKRRESPRIDATFRVSYASIDELVVAYTQDLSRGGMFLCSDRFLPLNAVLRLQLALPAGGAEIAIIARVVYVRDAAQAAQQAKPSGMGIQFLDLHEAAAAQIERFLTQRATAEAARPAVRRRLDVLVVDDAEAYREAAAAPFRRRGDRVRVAADGLEALAACLKDPPDVLLSDVQMPRMDGWALLRVVRARPSLASVPVIFLTTLGGDDERLRGYQLGVDDYVAKPFRPEELLARIDRLAARGDRSGRTHIEQKTLRGDLGQVALPSVLAFLEMERKTGVLLVVGGQTASVYLRDGRPVHAEIAGAPAGAPPRAQLFEVFGWREGQFEFALQDVDRGDTIGATATALLLDHARQDDERTRAGGGGFDD